MNSYEYYLQCRKNRARTNQYNGNLFFNEMNQLSRIAHDEIESGGHCVLFDTLYQMKKKADSIYYRSKQWKDIYAYDAYVITKMVDWKRSSVSHQIDKLQIQKMVFYIYTNVGLGEEAYLDLRGQIEMFLKEYAAYINDLKSDMSMSSNIEIKTKEETSANSLTDQDTDNSVQKEETPVTQVIEKRILMSEEDVNKIVEQRTQLRSQSAQNVKQFNEQFASLDDDLTSIQSSATEVVNQVINFKKELTDNYILQFASSLIELYDLIADSYEYHKKLIVSTDDYNYRNAIFNYQTFLEEISDKLSYIGVTTIISEPGDYFNGAYHQVVNTQSFGSQAIVKESLRAGFMYKDRVLQKEKVIIKV